MELRDLIPNIPNDGINNTEAPLGCYAITDKLNNCEDCIFALQDCDSSVNCSSWYRKDKNNVVFKKLFNHASLRYAIPYILIILDKKIEPMYVDILDIYTGKPYIDTTSLNKVKVTINDGILYTNKYFVHSTIVLTGLYVIDNVIIYNLSVTMRAKHITVEQINTIYDDFVTKVSKDLDYMEILELNNNNTIN